MILKIGYKSLGNWVYTLTSSDSVNDIIQLLLQNESVTQISIKKIEGFKNE